MLDNPNRIPNTVISRTFVAELIRDLCHFALDLESNGSRRPRQCPSSIFDRLKLFRELCECEPELSPYLIAEFAPIFRSIVVSFASLIDGSDHIPDQILCHFLAIISSLIGCDIVFLFDNTDGIDHFFSLCFASIGRMEPNLMAISLACLVRFLSAAEKMANPSFASAAKQRIVAHCVTANFAELAAFVLQNSLSADLIRSLWQFIHALSTIEFTISAMPDLVTALSALISAEPSLLTQQFPLGPTERGKRPLPLLTLCNLLRNSTPNSSASRQLATLLHVGIDDGPKNIEDSHISKTF